MDRLRSSSTLAMTSIVKVTFPSDFRIKYITVGFGDYRAVSTTKKITFRTPHRLLDVRKPTHIYIYIRLLIIIK